jgi:hypothetical protein
MFQLILQIVVGLLLLATLAAMYKGWTSRRGGLLWLAVWLAAALAIHWPWVTSRIARALNIGRGADLVFYCAVVAMLIGFWILYVRLRRMRRDITLLVRHLAIHEAELHGQPSARDDSAPRTFTATPAQKQDGNGN